MSSSTKVFKLLLTGFEPFGNPLPETNPSWEAIKSLNGQTISNGAVSFEINCQRIPVEYSPIEKLMPDLHQKDQFDYVIHVGQGPGHDIKIESQASAFGYSRLDNLGEFPKDNTAPHQYIPFSADPKTYTRYTTVDTQSLCKHLVEQQGCSWICRSEDAGRYLCEFTFFCSMGEADLLHLAHPDALSRTVLFVHVPVTDDKLTLPKITKTLQEIIYALPKFS